MKENVGIVDEFHFCLNVVNIGNEECIIRIKGYFGIDQIL